MRTQVAIFDVDDTLADLCSAVCMALARRKQPFLACKWWTHDWCTMFNMPLDELRKMLKTEVDYLKLRLLSPDWVSFIRLLLENNIQPLYVTARGNVFGNEARSITAQWLAKVGIDTSPSSVIPTNFQRSKAEIVKELRHEVVFTADDYVKEVVEYRKLFPRAMNVLMDSAINRNIDTSAHRVWCPKHEVRKLTDTFLAWRTAVNLIQ